MALEKAFAAAPGDWLNVENGVRTPIDTDPNWTTSNNCLWLYDRQNSGQRVGDPGNGTFTTPFGADRYFASILNNLGTIAVGLAAGVRTENDVRAFNQVNANLSNAITGSALLDGTALVGTNLIAANQAIGGGVSASRPAGWIGHTFLVATQPTKQAVTTSLVDARTRGLLDAKPEFSVPREVLQDL
jgi:hypothetical protein